jgi:hypothetical protein
MAARKKSSAARKTAAPAKKPAASKRAATPAPSSAKRPPLCKHGMPWFTANACRLRYLAGETCTEA